MATAWLVVAVVLALALLVLAVPLEVTFRVRGVTPLRGQIAICWLFRLVRARIRLHGARRARRTKARPAGRRRRFPLAALVRRRAFRCRAWRFLGDLTRALGVERLRVKLRLGFDDPADTGRLWALVGPLDAALQHLRAAQVHLEPEFGEAVFALRAHGRVCVVPLRLVGLVTAFVLSPASLRAWHALAVRHA